MQGFDAFDVLPDVTNFLTKFSAPCDLVYRESSGDERILHDCSTSSTAESACAAMDPAVSFDGRTVAYSVFRGTLTSYRQNINGRVLEPTADNARANNVTPTVFPNRHLDATEAQLHLVDIATGVVTALPFVEGEFDSGPAFLPNGRLAFTSSRDGNYSTLVWGTNLTSRGTRIWAMDIDGRNVDLSSHHSLAREEHPYVLQDGRVVYSSWQVFGGLPFRHTNGSPGGFTTLGNLFHLFSQNPDGAHNFAFYGQHSGDHSPSSFGASHVAAHFLTQDGSGRVWFADYYRGNNNGLGKVVGVMPEPAGQEGIGPHLAEKHADVYAPRDAIDFAPWASNGDQVSAPMPAPSITQPGYADPLPFIGKIGHPAAMPDGSLMVAWGKGPCSTVTGNKIFEALGREAPPHTSGSGQGTAINLITSLTMDTPACDVGIYRSTQIPSEHPSDLAVVVDSPDWHEFMARPVVPYIDIHNMEKPAIIPRADKQTSRSDLEVGTPFGLLGAASMVDRETHPRDGLHFAGEHQFHSQGTDTIAYTDEDICGVRILGVMPNRGSTTYRELHNAAGERVSILGEISVRNKDADGTVIAGDSSFLLRMPANTPYLMQGIDCDGRTLNTDQSWQSLRPGEMKTCGGCHVHSRPADKEFDETFASTESYRITKLGEGKVPLLSGKLETGDVTTREVDGYGMHIDFDTDIMPIFERRCVFCHGGVDPDAGLALDRPGLEGPADGPPSTWYCLVHDRRQECVPEAQRFDTGSRSGSTTFRRPQLTRHVRALNSRGSLLYWKAANARTDGRTDSTFDETSDRDDIDIDFGVDHPTEMTPEELGILSRWIDTGSGGNPLEALDTQKPTLTLAAIVEDDAVMSLKVGSVDLGSGIAPESLVVCVVPENGDECLDLSGSAAMHGVTDIALDAPLSDPSTEVYAKVEDAAGNITDLKRTVGWLLDSPPRDAGGSDAGDDLGHQADTGTIEGGCSCAIPPGTHSSSFLNITWWLMLVGVLMRRRRQ
jgi:MYXO-CTERM domain-containing protein